MLAALQVLDDWEKKYVEKYPIVGELIPPPSEVRHWRQAEPTSCCLVPCVPLAVTAGCARSSAFVRILSCQGRNLSHPTLLALKYSPVWGSYSEWLW